MTQETPGAGPTRTTLAGIAGNVLEWYDFALFGFFAPTLGQLFFPSTDRLASLMQTYGVFALGYFMRPLGGILFGRMGDRVGRKWALELSVILMALPTTLIAFLPTYAEAGDLAPALLILVRLMQGISVGGEITGAISFLAEHAPDNRRGFAASWVTASSSGGFLLGSAASALASDLMPADLLLAWGWRLPFLGGLVLGGLGLWLRRGITESPRYLEAVAGDDVSGSPLGEVLRSGLRPTLVTAALGTILIVGFNLCFVWMPTWLGHLRKPPLASALTANTIAMALHLGLIPVCGWLSDRLGRKPLITASAVSYLVLTLPAFLILDLGSFSQVIAAQCVLGICGAFVAGATPATLAELFPTRTRSSGIALGFNTAAMLGGMTPLIATWLLGVGGSILAPAAFMMAIAAVGALAVLGIEERAGRRLP